jgi:hypothetical protein
MCLTMKVSVVSISIEQMEAEVLEFLLSHQYIVKMLTRQSLVHKCLFTSKMEV